MAADNLWTRIPSALVDGIIVPAMPPPEIPKQERVIVGSVVLPQEMQDSLDEAHRYGEILQWYCRLSILNKAINQQFKLPKIHLTNHVIHLVSSVHNYEKIDMFDRSGAMRISDLIARTQYLFILKVYFRTNHHALRNFAHTNDRDYRGGNILHSAVFPLNGAISPSFAKFVIDMDVQHRLGLHQDRDGIGMFPLDNLLTAMSYAGDLEKENYRIVGNRLIATFPHIVEAPLTRDAEHVWLRLRSYEEDDHGFPQLHEAAARFRASLEEPSCISRFCSYIGEMFSSIFECFRNLFAR